MHKLFKTLLLFGAISIMPIKTSLAESPNWYKPKPSVTWQWQLSGTINSNYDVEIYDIDLFDTPKSLIQQLHAEGKKVICYFSAGSYEEWRSDANQFNRADLGNPLEDWQGERWLDIRSRNVLNIMRSRLDIAQQKTCDGVEPDNMDGYTNQPGFSLTANDQLIYNKKIALEAHNRGLAIGLKNDLDQIPELLNHFDFAVNEQCFEYDECDSLTPFILQNKAVLNAEYLQGYINNENKRKRLCTQANDLKLSTLVLAYELDDSLRFSCETHQSEQDYSFLPVILHSLLLEE